MNEKLSPVKSIRKYCLECSCFEKGQVLNCQIIDCPLFPFRLGKNPNRKKADNKAEGKIPLARGVFSEKLI